MGLGTLAYALSDWDAFYAQKMAEQEAQRALFSAGPDAWWKAVTDPIVSDWENSPGHVIGMTAGTVGSFAIPGGAALKGLRGTKVLEEVTSGATFIANTSGVVVPTSRATLVSGFEAAGLLKTATKSPGMQYSLPGGDLVRVMEPTTSAGLRASFTNSAGAPISPFTSKPVQPPPGLTSAERLDYVRSRTHVELR